MVINIDLPEDVITDLDTVIEITGQTTSEIISRELESYLAHFRKYSEPDCGKIVPCPAMFIHGVTPVEKKCAENEGRTTEIWESPCYVLSDRSIYSNPYYKIWDTERRNIISVPAYCIRFPQDD